MPNARSALTPLNRPLALGSLLVALTAIGCAGLPQFLKENNDKIVAIDVALQPDATLVDRTKAPESHITLVRRFVRASDVHSLSAAVANVLATTRLDQLNLKATGYRSDKWNGVLGTVLVLEVSPELRRLEERMVDAVRMFAVNPESAESFIVTPDGIAMSDETIDAIERFVPEWSGVNYRAHVTTNAMPSADAKQLESQPFTAFTFKPAGALVYQLGRAGTAERILWTWTGEYGARRP
jgi:hypothetical protein